MNCICLQFPICWIAMSCKWSLQLKNPSCKANYKSPHFFIVLVLITCPLLKRKLCFTLTPLPLRQLHINSPITLVPPQHFCHPPIPKHPPLPAQIIPCWLLSPKKKKLNRLSFIVPIAGLLPNFSPNLSTHSLHYFLIPDSQGYFLKH